jgi:hypothetical protein
MRIGLIAMSGVRVHNPKLAALGVTLPQFVNRGQVIAQLPSLALLVLRRPPTSRSSISSSRTSRRAIHAPPTTIWWR